MTERVRQKESKTITLSKLRKELTERKKGTTMYLSDVQDWLVARDPNKILRGQTSAYNFTTSFIQALKREGRIVATSMRGQYKVLETPVKPKTKKQSQVAVDDSLAQIGAGMYEYVKQLNATIDEQKSEIAQLIDEVTQLEGEINLIKNRLRVEIDPKLMPDKLLASIKNG